MDSPITNTIANVAGRGVGALAALSTLGQSGGLANYMFQRQRQLADPAIRATFADSPFAAGMFQVGGGTTAPGVTPVAAPSDFLQYGQPVAGPDNAWLPRLSPLSPEAMLKVRGAQGVVHGLESTDPLVKAQSKLVAGVPLDPGELVGAVDAGRALQARAGAGSQVQLDIPGGKVVVGSPYQAGSYQTPGMAAAAASARGGVVVPDAQGGYQVVPLAPGEYTSKGEADAAGAPIGKVAVPTTRGTYLLEAPEKPQPPATLTVPAPSTGPATPPPKPAAQPLPESSRVAPPGPVPAARGVASPADMPGAEPPPPAPAPAPAAAPVAAPPAAPPVPAPVAAAPPTAPVVVPIAPVSREISDEEAARIMQPPAAAPAGGGPPPAIAYPPPAPAQPPGPPFITVPELTLPPAAPAAVTLPPPPAAAPGVAQPPRDAKTGLPLSTLTQESASGKATYSTSNAENAEQVIRLREVGISDPRLATPEQIAALNKRDLEHVASKKATEADVTRLRAGTSEAENKLSTMYVTYLNQLNKFYERFPTPADREGFFTPGVRTAKDYTERFWTSPAYQDFRTLLAPFGEKLFDRAGAALTETEFNLLKPLLPTGDEQSATVFEKRLQQFGDTLRLQIAARSAFQRLPVGEQTAKTYNDIVTNFARERAAAREAVVAPKAPEVLWTGPTPRE